MSKALLMLLTHSFIAFPRSFDSLTHAAADRWSELMLSIRRGLNSKTLAAIVVILFGGLLCTLLLDEGLLTTRIAIIVLHLGLFLSLVSAAFCFNLAGLNATWSSYAFFSVWGGLAVIGLFEFSWKQFALAAILYVPYFHVGRLLAALFVCALAQSYARREAAGRNQGGSR